MLTKDAGQREKLLHAIRDPQVIEAIADIAAGEEQGLAGVGLEGAETSRRREMSRGRGKEANSKAILGFLRIF